MKLIVGLGNPGSEYENTRHNAGFMFLDYLAYDKWQIEKKLFSEISTGLLQDTKYILLKPQTFMNDSGLAVKAAIKWFDLDSTEDLLVVHDDLDIVLGNYKLQFSKSPKDHNGIISIQNHLGSNAFWRLRVGVDNRGKYREPGIDYVLKKFKKDELKDLDSRFPDMKDNIFSNFLKL